MELRTARKVIRAASVVGDQLINSEGKELGMIHELLIDAEAGTVTFAVVSLDRLPGLDSTLFVVPWQTLEPWHEQHKFVLDIDNVKLLEALSSTVEPALDEEGWQWVTNGSESFGYRQYRN